MYIPVAFDLIWSIPLAVILTGICRILRSGMFIDLGYYIGVPRVTPVKVKDCYVLETAYRRGFTLDKSTLEQLSKRSDMTQRQIQIWFRKRAKQDMPSDIHKFTESSWRLCLRVPVFVIGLIILWKKTWFLETKHAWLDWPKHDVTTDVYFYFIFQLSIYLHFMLTMPTDNKRKDFLLSFTHHICTIILMSLGWIYNFVRIGTLILLVNDAPDPWIELSKILVYSKKNRLSEITFVIFVIVWLLGKDGIYPLRFLYSTLFEAPVYLSVPTYVIVFFNFFLFIVMTLNLLWTYNIFEVIMHKLRYGELKDIRSDSEFESEDADEKKAK